MTVKGEYGQKNPNFALMEVKEFPPLPEQTRRPSYVDCHHPNVQKMEEEKEIKKCNLPEASEGKQNQVTR